VITSSCAYTVLAGIMTVSKTVSLGNTSHFALKWSPDHILAPWAAKSYSEAICIAPCCLSKKNPDYNTVFQGPNLDYQNTRTRVCMIEGIYHTGELCVIMYPLEKSLRNKLSYKQQDIAEKLQVIIWIREYSPK